MARLSSADTVRVKGLDELRRELRKLDDKGLTAELKQANFDAAKLVVEGAQGKASNKMERSAASTLTASRAAARAAVNFGGPRAPYAMGAEFGAARNVLRKIPPRQVKGKTTRDSSGRFVAGEIKSVGSMTMLGWNQFKAHRGSGANAGYFLWPAVRDKTPQIVETYGDAVERIASKAFPN